MEISPELNDPESQLTYEIIMPQEEEEGGNLTLNNFMLQDISMEENMMNQEDECGTENFICLNQEVDESAQFLGDLQTFQIVSLEYTTLPNETETQPTFVNDTEEKLYTCEVCQAHFTKKIHLRNHFRVHTEKIEFKCRKCNYKCFKERFLLNHVQKHKEFAKSQTSKHLHCSVCNLKFSSCALLNKHLDKKHIVEKTFKCSVCGFQYSTESNLICHMQTVCCKKKNSTNGEKSFKCSVCEYKYTEESYLLSHIKNCHEQDEED